MHGWVRVVAVGAAVRPSPDLSGRSLARRAPLQKRKRTALSVSDWWRILSRASDELEMSSRMATCKAWLVCGCRVLGGVGVRREPIRERAKPRESALLAVEPAPRAAYRHRCPPSARVPPC